MVKRVVLVIDMLRCFLEPGGALYVGDHAREIIPHVRKLLQSEIAAGSKILYLSDRHIPDDYEFKVYPPHCIEGTEEARVIPELSQYPGEIIAKRRYSAFYGSMLEIRLNELKPEKIVICGVMTNICVMYTAADARDRGYEVEVPVNCVATNDEKAHRWALDQMEKVLGVKLTKV